MHLMYYIPNNKYVFIEIKPVSVTFIAKWSITDLKLCHNVVKLKIAMECQDRIVSNAKWTVITWQQ